MNTHVEFRSDQFPPYDGENEVVNPGRYGRRLAEFLMDGLRREGFEVRNLQNEDWGWVINLENKEFPLWIGCGNYDEYADGFVCFIEPHQAVIRRLFKRIDTTKIVASVRDALDLILKSNPSVRDVRWWTHEEFNQPHG
jgi:hypothetical protein